MQTFNEALDQVGENTVASLLLGNGFSRSWNDDIFNYSNLLEIANFGQNDARIRSLFQRLDTHDFESVMKSLLVTQSVLESYEGNQGLIAEIQSDQESLKNALISAIAATHPARPNEVEQNQYINARGFLSTFSQIFSLNYDLLLYWARNQQDLPPAEYQTDDGFRGQEWKGHRTDQCVHFLHGGLHLADTDQTIRKHSFTATGQSIVEYVREKLEQNQFPLFVAEPSSDKKMSRIQHNPYLNFCYRALHDIEGVIFIHGHSFDANDSHIFNAISQSRVDHIFVSVFGDPNSEINRVIQGNARGRLETEQRSVDFYDASTAEIWA